MIRRPVRLGGVKVVMDDVEEEPILEVDEMSREATMM